MHFLFHSCKVAYCRIIGVEVAIRVGRRPGAIEQSCALGRFLDRMPRGLVAPPRDSPGSSIFARYFRLQLVAVLRVGAALPHAHCLLQLQRSINELRALRTGSGRNEKPPTLEGNMEREGAGVADGGKLVSFAFKQPPRQCKRLTSSMDACVSSVEARSHPGRTSLAMQPRCSLASPRSQSRKPDSCKREFAENMGDV